VALAAGAATLGSGIVLGLTAKSEYDQFRSTRVSTRAQAEDANQRLSSIQTRGTLGNVMIPAGAVVLAAAAVLLGIDLSANDSGAEKAHARVQLIPLPSGGALSLRGSFGGAQ